METILSRIRKAGLLSSPSPGVSAAAKVVKTFHKSLPVEIPDSFLAPLPDSSVISVEKVDFANSLLPEYKKLYAVVLDNVLSQEECDELIILAEKSAGADLETLEQGKRADIGEAEGHAGWGDGGGAASDRKGWEPALVNTGRNRGVLALDYRNSDRIIWNQQDVATRLWKRVCQVESVRDYLAVIDGDLYYPVVGDGASRRGERWVVADRGLNESMKFLRYGRGQFFKEHCDGTYETPDGTERSLYTLHLYLNDSVSGLNPDAAKPLINLDLSTDDPVPKEQSDTQMLEGGATTFHSRNMVHRLDVHPKAGRVLIFQQKRLLHSGDDVVAGVKYTVRGDIMYKFEMDGDDRGVVFG